MGIKGPVAGEKVFAAGQGKTVIGGDLQYPVLSDIVDGQEQFVIRVGNLIEMGEKRVGFLGRDYAGGPAVK